MSATKNKTVLLTGATGGIGSAIAKKLTSEGAHVVGTSPSPEEASVLEQELRSTDATARVISVDFLDNNLSNELESSLAPFQEFDWIIHCAGYIDPQESFENLTNLKKTFEVNLYPLFALFQIFSDRLTHDGGVISISSTASLTGNGKLPLYATSKGALNTLTQSIAHSFRDTNKRAVVLCPGPTNTQMREELAHDAAQQQSPEVLADAVLRIIQNSDAYQNGDVWVVRDENESRFSRFEH